MSSRPELPVKLYYRIGEVAEVVGVEPHVLRYWESEFGSIRPQKSPKGQRVYSRRDLEKLMRVRELLYEQGYTIAGAKKRLRDLTSKKAQEATEPEAAPPTSSREPDAPGVLSLASAQRPVEPEAGRTPSTSRVDELERREWERRGLELADERRRRVAYENELLALRDLLRHELAELGSADEYFDVDG